MVEVSVTEVVLKQAFTGGLEDLPQDRNVGKSTEWDQQVESLAAQEAELRRAYYPAVLTKQGTWRARAQRDPVKEQEIHRLSAQVLELRAKSALARRLENDPWSHTRADCWEWVGWKPQK